MNLVHILFIIPIVTNLATMPSPIQSHGGLTRCSKPHINIWYNSTARKLPIQECMGKIAVQLKLHWESEIACN